MRRAPSDPSSTDLRLKVCDHDSQSSHRIKKPWNLEDNILVYKIHMLKIAFLSSLPTILFDLACHTDVSF